MPNAESSTAATAPEKPSAALSAVPAQVCLMDALYVLTARLVRGEGVDRIDELVESRLRIQRRR